MISKASTPEQYIKELPEDRVDPIKKLRASILENLPDGFQEVMNYGMVGYVVPHQLYPSGYHCDPKKPLPFIGFASQKNHISFYHMGLYDEGSLLKWLQAAFPKHSKFKLDMGKCCIRFKKPEHIPYTLIEELCSKMTPKEWIAQYEKAIKR